MKKLFLLFLLTFSTMLFANTEYSLNYPVNDYANVLSESEKNTLSEKLMNEYKKSNTQIAILTIPSLEGQSIEQFSMDILQKFKLGLKGVDNGVLFIISTGDRKTRIEVGSGFEGSLTDARSSQILRGSREHLKAQRYFDAFSFIVDEILVATQPPRQELEQNKAETGSVVRKAPAAKMSQATKDMLLLCLVGFLIVVGCILLVRRLLMKIKTNKIISQAIQAYNTNKVLANECDQILNDVEKQANTERSLGNEYSSIQREINTNISENSRLKSDLVSKKSSLELNTEKNKVYRENPRQMLSEIDVQTSNDALLSFLLKHTK